MANPPASSFYRHPAWGVGIVVEENEGKRTLDFEDGVRRIVAVSFGKLELVTPAPEQAAQLETMSKGIQRAADAKPKSKRPDRPPPAPKMTFDQQIGRFEMLFVGSFGGEAYQREERGLADGTGKKPHKDTAIELAHQELSKEKLEQALSNGDFTSVLASLKNALTSMSLLHPIELIRLTKMEAENLPSYVGALRDLLHGTGDFGPRFDALVTNLHVKDPTWTMATIVSAMFTPGEHVFVKPSFFKDQAVILGIPVDYKSIPDANVYEQFRKVALEVRRRLEEKGQKPRDLMDVYTFIWRTLASPKAESTKVDKKAPKVASP